jgi:hypothetical protein
LDAYADVFEVEGLSGEVISNSTDDALMDVTKCMGVSEPLRVMMRAKFKEWKAFEPILSASPTKSIQDGLIHAVQLQKVSLAQRLLASDPELVNELDECAKFRPTSRLYV